MLDIAVLDLARLWQLYSWNFDKQQCNNNIRVYNTYIYKWQYGRAIIPYISTLYRIYFIRRTPFNTKYHNGI